MARIVEKRVCAQREGGFVIFLIGMRLNKPWKFWKWLPVATAMPKMLIELAKQPELGLLHAENQFSFPNLTVTQYWESFEKDLPYSVCVVRLAEGPVVAGNLVGFESIAPQIGEAVEAVFDAITDEISLMRFQRAPAGPKGSP